MRIVLLVLLGVLIYLAVRRMLGSITSKQLDFWFTIVIVGLGIWIIVFTVLFW